MAGHRVRTTLLVVVTTVAIAPVVAFAAYSALVFWTGCFLECSEPERPAAVGSGAVAVVFLAFPVLVGIASARDDRRLIRWVAGIGLGLVVAIVAATWILGFV